MTGTFVYDDTCGFCSWWAQFFAERSSFGIVGFSELTDEERERLPEDYEDCAHFLRDGAVFSCGAAIEEGLRDAGVVPEELFDFLNNFSDYADYRERAYRKAADRRDAWGFFISEEPPARRDPGSD
jgi:predicted DCC family thiol-disulfide oxidoreductase YuxK